jgi:hypothetical protein
MAKAIPATGSDKPATIRTDAPKFEEAMKAAIEARQPPKPKATTNLANGTVKVDY